MIKRKEDSMSVIYPLFEECKGYTLDPYWQEQFSNFAANRFPQGVRYDQNRRNLVLKLDGKTEIVALPENNPSETFQIIMKILKSRLNLRSTRDLKIQRQEMEENLEEQKAKAQEHMLCEWRKIKPRNLKDQLIMDYIATLKSKYSLTPAEVRHLTSVVQLGFQFHSLSSSDVAYKNGVIENIDHLEFCPKTRKFFTPVIAHFNKTEKAAKIPNPFYSALDKYLKEDSLRVTKIKS